MPITYLAYGLRLSSDFPLPGMAPREAEELPALTLALRGAGELAGLWSGGSQEPTWRGRLGDGVDLTLEHGIAGDVLFTYGDRARFRLDAVAGTLCCAPSQASLDWQRALIGKVLPIVSLIYGYEVLHAAVVDSPQGVVAIAAPGGAGKSTLAVELLRRGWSLFADDALVLESGDGVVKAHPGTPHMNLADSVPDTIEPQTLGETIDFLAGERWLAAHRTVGGPRPVTMVCLLERGPGLTLASEALDPNPLALAPYMLRLPSDAERQRSRFCVYSDLMDDASLVRLTAGTGDHPAQIADALEQALPQTAGCLAGGLA